MWENLSPKYFSEYRLESEALGLKGRVDRFSLEKTPKLKIIPFEIKNRGGEIYHEDEVQITAYTMLLEDKFKVPIKTALIESGKIKHKIEINTETKKQVLEIAEKIRNLKTTPPPIPSNFNKCRYCGLSEFC